MLLLEVCEFDVRTYCVCGFNCLLLRCRFAYCFVWLCCVGWLFIYGFVVSLLVECFEVKVLLG